MSEVFYVINIRVLRLHSMDWKSSLISALFLLVYKMAVIHKFYTLQTIVRTLIVSISKFSTVTGSLHAYLSHNQYTITWVSSLQCGHYFGT